MVDQTLYNWVKAQRQGKLQGADSKVNVSAEQMEISRLRAELVRVKMERDILGKATAYFPKGTDMSRYDERELDALAATLNGRPRKTLGWRTPAEALNKLISAT